MVETCINLLKISNYSSVTELCYLNTLDTYSISYLNSELSVNTHNNNLGEAFKNIFEKKLILVKNAISELYSYNTQLLIQPQGLILYFTLTLTQLILFNLSFKKNLIQI